MPILIIPPWSLVANLCDYNRKTPINDEVQKKKKNKQSFEAKESSVKVQGDEGGVFFFVVLRRVANFCPQHIDT